MTVRVVSHHPSSISHASSACVCAGGAYNCLVSKCPSCRIVDFAEELPPCASDEDHEEWPEEDEPEEPEAKPKSRTDPRVNSIRLLFRSLRAFESVYESDGVIEILAPNGCTWNLFDIQYLYRQAMRRPTGLRAFDRLHPTLPLRQQQAIELFLVLNMPEDEAAETMGLSRTNPVGMYATSGLTKLLKFLDEGRLRRFGPDHPLLLAIA
jgi:hypothetical protein